MTDDTARTAPLNRDRKRLAAEARALRANLRRRKAHPTRKSTRTGLMEDLGRTRSVRADDDGTHRERDAPDPPERAGRVPDCPQIPAASTGSDFGENGIGCPSRK